MKPVVNAAMALIAAIALVACESGLDQRYLDASLGQSLELPPDLSKSETESNFELPGNFFGDDPDARDRVPVLARVESLQLGGSDRHYWLDVEEPIDNLYQLVKNFWAAEGYRLIIDEPVIGIMQTEWVHKEEGSIESEGNWLEQLFGEDDLSSAQDQFRTRFERTADGRSRIYIVHRGTEFQYVLESKQQGETTSATSNTGSEDAEESLWRFRQPEPELEIEMLSRLMVYLGLQQNQADQQVAEVKLFKPRAFLRFDPEEGSPFLIIKDTYEIAWNKVYNIVERLNFDIATAQFELGFANEGVIVVNSRVIEEREEGGFFSLFTSSQQAERQFVLVISPESHEWTRMAIETEKGEFDTTTEGAEFLTLLYEQIR